MLNKSENIPKIISIFYDLSFFFEYKPKQYPKSSINPFILAILIIFLVVHIKLASLSIWKARPVIIRFEIPVENIAVLWSDPASAKKLYWRNLNI